MMRSSRSRWQSLGELKRIHGLMIVNGLFNSYLPPPPLAAAAAAPALMRDLLLSSVHLSVTSNNTTAMEYAHQVFKQIPEPDLFVWNTIIRGTAHSSNPSLAVSLYFNRLMKINTVNIRRPDSFTFIFLLKACAKLSSASTGTQFHGMIVKFGFESDAFVRNALINLHASCGDLAIATTLFDETARNDVVARSALVAGYAKRGELGAARRLFDEAPCRDVVSWNIMITGYANQGQMENARQLFDQAPQRDVVSWNTMIAGYSKCGYHAKALEMYEEMTNNYAAGRRRDTSTSTSTPDEATMLSLLSSCADSGALDVGQRIHRSLLEVHSPNGLSMLHGNALIDMYAKCGSIERAVQVFEDMRERDVWTWNSIIGGLALHGHTRECMCLFAEMQRTGVRPNEVTFVSLLGMCSHNGMVEEGRIYLSVMTYEYGMEPSLKHYGCIVDMLGRAGLLQEAFEFIGAMKMEPSPVIWRTLLGACKIHDNVSLGRIANEKLLGMGCDDKSGDYVLLSNIYSSADEWLGAEKVRKLMDDKGVRKEAGCSSLPL